MSWRQCALATAVLAALAATAACGQTSAPAPSAKAWADLAKLPDWSGIWIPDMADQNRQMVSNPPPWNPGAARQIKALEDQERAGDPKGLFYDCLPEAMPSWMLISHNAMEVLFTPGRVTLLGEADGNRLRRIYTDGRKHPDDPDLTFHGHSVGHWEGEALLVDTVGVLPETLIAVSEAVGLPNNGDLHVVERIRLAGPDTLQDELVITAPHVFTGPWKTTRLFRRNRTAPDIVEGVCRQGDFSEARDGDGNAVFRPLPQDKGIPVAPGR
jgi:hypothetical protein